MPSHRRKFLARCALAAFVLLCAGWLATLDYRRKISSDILDLIPPNERSAEITVVRSLSGDLHARVMLFALRDSSAPGRPPAEAARFLAGALARSPAFAEALALDDSATQAEWGGQIFAQRFALLLPSYLGEHHRAFVKTGRPESQFSPWLAERAAADLEAFLGRPEAMAMQDLIPRDPLLLVPRLIDRASSLGGLPDSAGGAARVWARIKASPLSEEGQQPVFAAIAEAQAQARSRFPTVTVQWSGVDRFAAANRNRIEGEVKVLNVVSILVVLAVGCVFVRRLWKMLHLIPVIACSLLGAWTVTTLLFDRVHIVVFVIGSLLSGVAIDYGFYIYMQPSLRPEESYPEKLRRLLQPLLASCLTTVLGFSLLLFSDLPVLRQIGLFVSAGLLSALAAAMVYFAQLDQPYLEGRIFRRLGPSFRRGEARAENWRGEVRVQRTKTGRPRLPHGLLAVAALVALIGPWRLHWQDDVRELEVPQPKLAANEAALEALFGDTPDRSAYLTYGNSAAEARQRLEDFLKYESTSAPAAPATSLGLVFPTEKDWTDLPLRLRELNGFAEDLRSALDRHGFTSDSFDPFFHDWSLLLAHPPSGPYAGLYRGLGAELTGPLADLSNLRPPLYWFITLVDQPEGLPLPPGLFTVSVNQLQSLNRLFTVYRWSALRLSLIGLGLVIASVLAIYRGAAALRIALIPAGSCFFIFGMLGLFGQTLNFFHLLGAFLGICLAHNYSIFSSESSRTRTAPPVPVRLSALCATASFGVLSFSGIPVVHALGATVALIVLTALAFIELEPFVRGNSNLP